MARAIGITGRLAPDDQLKPGSMFAHGEVRATRRTGIPWVPEPSAQQAFIERDPRAIEQCPRPADGCASHFPGKTVLRSLRGGSRKVCIFQWPEVRHFQWPLTLRRGQAGGHVDTGGRPPAPRRSSRGGSGAIPPRPLGSAPADLPWRYMRPIPTRWPSRTESGASHHRAREPLG